MLTAESDNPFEMFAAWFDEAGAQEINDPNAVALATATAGGAPSLRMVLLKGYDEDGFVFYTNLNSRKGRQIAENPQAAMLFHWKSLRRQIRIEGKFTAVGDDEADAYFASRPRGSQIGAWASRQSETLGSMFELETEVAKFTARFGIGAIPRPAHWSGFRLAPDHFEFWQDGLFRLHKRLVFEPAGPAGGWTQRRLFP